MKWWRPSLKLRVLMAGIVASLPFYTGSNDAPLMALVGFLFVMFATSRLADWIPWW